MEYKFENMTLLDSVKTLCAYKGTSLRRILKKLSEQHNFSNCYPSFYNKLKNNTLKVRELNDIASVLGCEIVIKDLA